MVTSHIQDREYSFRLLRNTNIILVSQLWHKACLNISRAYIHRCCQSFLL